MRTSQTSCIELRAELGHAVFIPDFVALNSKVALEQRMELRFGKASVCSFVPAGFYGDTAARESELPLSQPLEKIQKGQGGAKENQRLALERNCFGKPVPLPQKKALAGSKPAGHAAEG